MKFALILAHARPPERLCVSDPGVSIFSAENFTLESGEVHAYRTGISISVPPGKYGLLKENQAQGVKGIAVIGGLVRTKDTQEIRVSLTNSHREAYEVKAGQAIAQVLWFDATEEDVEEVSIDELREEQENIQDEVSAANAQARADKAVSDAQAEAKKVREKNAATK